MRFIELTQGRRTIVDDYLFESLSKYRWYFNMGYAMRNSMIGTKRKILRMHREIMGTPGGSFTDHINGDRLDNRRENLRICTKAENGMNREAQGNNKSGFKGVSWYEQGETWRAQVSYAGKRFHLGYYKTKEDAARAYNRRAIELYGAFAKLNVIGQKGE